MSPSNSRMEFFMSDDISSSSKRASPQSRSFKDRTIDTTFLVGGKKSDVSSPKSQQILSSNKKLSTDIPYFQVVGNTPMIKITDHIYAKLETYNPTGSVKDRMIRAILKQAILEDQIDEDTVLVEATSGNTGIALSAAGAALGLAVEIFMPENMSESRKQMMRSFGTELHLVGPNDFMAAIEGRDKLVKTNPKKYWSPKQFSNMMNQKAHLTTTCPEIHEQLNKMAPGRKWEAMISGSGTGGTISAFCKYKKVMGLDYSVVMVEPKETPETHGIQGIYDGADFLMNRDEITFTWKVSTQDAIDRARQFAKEFGILVGISAGANLAIADAYVQRFNPEGIVTLLLCDRGERYMESYDIED